MTAVALRASGLIAYAVSVSAGGGVQRGGSGFAPNDYFTGGLSVLTTGSAQSALLQKTGSLSTVVSLPTGGNFELSFKVAQRVGFAAPGPQSVKVRLDGPTTLGDFTPNMPDSLATRAVFESKAVT